MAKTLELLRVTVPCTVIILLTACGGGSSGSSPSVRTYNVSATAGTGGSISPSSATVDAGGTTTFTITPNSGYTISSVTGCGGTLSGNTYSIATVNAGCTVTASFVAQYTVTGTAGSGGTISPSNATVNGGGTTTFAITPSSGYVISGVTGCGGTLSGNTYTTGAVNAGCSVTASFSAAFTWVGGSTIPFAAGVYGTEGVAAANNVPSARHGVTPWTDASGNLWLYGGYESTSGTVVQLNDLWKYSPSSGEWTWVNGSGSFDAPGDYGTQGLAAATNQPGAFNSAVTWTDANGNLWMWGGFGNDSAGTQGWLNSLWEYSPSSGEWTWVGGSTTADAKGVYGTQGVPAATNWPGARVAGSWTDANDNVWMWGGFGYDSAGTKGRLSDLWKYSPATDMWTWVSGPDIVNQKGVYGTRGVAAATNWPGARDAGPIVRDASGNVWMFGGYGYDSMGTLGYLNDLWEYSPSSGMWTWIAGSSTVNAEGTYGTQGVAAPVTTNGPGARYCAAGWTDAYGNLWLFGGSGYDSTGTLGELNDLWEYSPPSGEATWVRGSNTVNATGVYGTQGVAAAGNAPGGRDCGASWTAGGFVWLFGGEGYNSSGGDPNAPEWNDLWKYPVQ